MDAGFYWPTTCGRGSALPSSARTSRELGDDWWRRPETGALLRELFREGTRPTTEEIAERIGFDLLDTTPLVAELTAVAA